MGRESKWDCGQSEINMYLVFFRLLLSEFEERQEEIVRS